MVVLTDKEVGFAGPQGDYSRKKVLRALNKTFKAVEQAFFVRCIEGIQGIMPRLEARGVGEVCTSV